MQTTYLLEAGVLRSLQSRYLLMLGKRASLGHQLIGQFVDIAGRQREVSGEQFSRFPHVLAEGIAGTAFSYPPRDGLCKSVQRLLLDPFIDARVGKYPYLPFEDGEEKEKAPI